MSPQFLLPERAFIGREKMRDGAYIRTLLYPHDEPIANLLLLTGRADFHEKWAGAIHELHDAGFAIASFDWRGQGGSTRMAQNGAGHIDSFETWLCDLDALSDWAQESLGKDKPWLALGHSMGGHLLTRWINDPSRANQPLRRALKGVVLAAPFFGLGMPVWLRTAALKLAPWQVARGNAANYAWGQIPYGPKHQRPERQLLLTGSRAHFEDEGLWIRAKPELATGGVSWGWINAFAQSEAALESYPLEDLELPVLLLLAGREHLVDNKAAMRLASRMPHVQQHLVAQSAHEILRETDAVRAEIIQLIRDFTLKAIS